MAEKKEFVKLWLSYSSYFEPYSDGEVGRLVRAMMKYRESREEPVFNGNERFVWPIIKREIDSDRKTDTSGENHWNWKGGITPKSKKERNSKEYKAWRAAVFKRDNYTCQICGKRGVKLNAHHKKRWSEHPELRYSVENGMTLCERCHKDVHRRSRR